MAPIEYQRPFLYPKQLDAIFCPERYALVEATTKSGKTHGCIAWIIEQAILSPPNRNFWWVAPVTRQADIAFQRIKSALPRGLFTSYQSPWPRVELPNSNVIWFLSADNPDSLYGEDVWGAVIDEASRVKEDAFYAIRSTLTATQGPIRIIGNVKGRKNWFYRMARKAEDEGSAANMHYAKITAYDASEAAVLEAGEIEDARRNLPEMVFRELYLAEAGDDGDNPFGIEHIRACMIPSLAPGPAVAWGVDVAKHRDWFVVIGLNAQGEVCAFDRWRHLPWPDSVQRVWNLVGTEAPVLVDSTGVGDAALDFLQRDHRNIQGFTFTASSKQKLVEGLITGIQSREVKYPDGPIRRELEDMEYQVKPSGYSYQAVSGAHDDCVMALALLYRLHSHPLRTPSWAIEAREWEAPEYIPVFAR